MIFTVFKTSDYRNRTTVFIDTLQELLNFSNESIIVNAGDMTIEIYDDHRE